MYMFKIDQSSNSIQRLDKTSFSSLGFRERDHLQEWIAKSPDVLGEELLIIQKEFSGFDDTNERLDLLALDKQGSLVIIENKLDDSGKDVTWQALKYTSYCSGLTKANIADIFQDYLNNSKPSANAKEIITEFLDEADFDELELNKGVTQRIILIAAKFRKEVTSTVLWLLNFKVRLQCFRATPYDMNGELFLNIEQIIPTPDAEDYMIGMAEKARDDIDVKTELNERHLLKRKFWGKLLEEINLTNCTLFHNKNPTHRGHISSSTGVSGIGLVFAVSKSYGRAEIYIDVGERTKNKAIFSFLYATRDEIENTFGGKLEWERLDEKRACRIKAEKTGNVLDQEQWAVMIKGMVNSMCRLEKAIQPYLIEISEI